MQTSSHEVIEARELRAFFRETVVTAIDHQQLQAGEETIVYLINLLSGFARSDRFYEWTADGYTLRPLALALNDAMQARGREERNVALRRVGDVALFVSGLFADSLHRRNVDVDYYIAMGGTAYGFLSGVLQGNTSGRTLGAVFEELSCQFSAFVDVLGEVGDNTALNSDADIMRVYDVWRKTGSRRAERRLRELGVQLGEHGANATPH